MIYVNQEQLDQVEYLIEQSCKGHHILFETDLIRKVFVVNSKSVEEHADIPSSEKHIENLILQPTLSAKKAYLDRLDEPTLNNVIRTYFSIVENNLFEEIKFC